MAAARFMVFMLFLCIASGGPDMRWLGETKVLKLQGQMWGGGKPHPRRCSLPRKSRRENGATILEMKHQGHYCSGSTKTIEEDRTEQLIFSDEARVKHLLSKAKGEKPEAQLPLSSGVNLRTLNYIVNVELGGRKTTVIVDTGSDLTWIQCRPCTYCYNQRGPIFDPTRSPSYRPIPCSSPICANLLRATGNSGICRANAQPNCKYALSYGDGSYSRGELGHDRINLAGTVVDGFVFGCGRSNRGLFGGASGLMGLGRTQLSLISQTTVQFGGIFSYCLPSTEIDSSGSLVLGGNSSAFRNITPISYTRMISNAQSSSPFYLLNLTGINVGGEDLQASGLILIDSGTVITRLAPSVHRALKKVFSKQFSRYPSAPTFSILDTCFNLSGHQEVSIPTLKFRFEQGAEVTVDATGMLYFVKRDASQVCLAIASLSYEGQLGIIGNYQQKNLRVVYDTVRSRVGFAGETCTYS